MPISRSPSRASATISRYLGSKMWSGRNTLGNITTFGSGKIGIVGGSIAAVQCERSVDRPALVVHIVHQHILAERPWRREIRLAVTDLRHAPHEGHKVVVTRQHERVDHDAR